jgi:hypothetical protein
MPPCCSSLSSVLMDLSAVPHVDFFLPELVLICAFVEKACLDALNSSHPSTGEPPATLSKGYFSGSQLRVSQ